MEGNYLQMLDLVMQKLVIENAALNTPIHIIKKRLGQPLNRLMV